MVVTIGKSVSGFEIHSYSTTLHGIYFLTFHFMKGTIKRVNDKGFGFIAPESGGPDVFFHATACPNGDFKQMAEGNTVSFEMGEGPKGPNATNVVMD
jgi:CspA family cold shock protein